MSCYTYNKLDRWMFMVITEFVPPTSIFFFTYKEKPKCCYVKPQVWNIEIKYFTIICKVFRIQCRSNGFTKRREVIHIIHIDHNWQSVQRHEQKKKKGISQRVFMTKRKLYLGYTVSQKTDITEMLGYQSTLVYVYIYTRHLCAI